MALDNEAGIVYVLGRYVDRRARDTLADFYSYNIDSDKWTVLSTNTESDGGPPLVWGRLIIIVSFLGCRKT